MKEITKKEAKYCNLLEKTVYLVIKGVETPGGIGSQLKEFVPGQRECSELETCYKLNKNCKWAKGHSQSNNDPMEEITKLPKGPKLLP